MSLPALMNFITPESVNISFFTQIVKSILNLECYISHLYKQHFSLINADAWPEKITIHSDFMTIFEGYKLFKTLSTES